MFVCARNGVSAESGVGRTTSAQEKAHRLSHHTPLPPPTLILALPSVPPAPQFRTRIPLFSARTSRAASEPPEHSGRRSWRPSNPELEGDGRAPARAKAAPGGVARRLRLRSRGWSVRSGGLAVRER